jgi:hypothetical protein
MILFAAGGFQSRQAAALAAEENPRCHRRADQSLSFQTLDVASRDGLSVFQWLEKPARPASKGWKVGLASA